MILWTIQPPEVVKILEEFGNFACDANLSENFEFFHDAYLWIAGEMDKRNIPHPNNLSLPLWAWHTRNYKHKKPDFRTIGLGNTGERYACIEFEIPDELVLLSDFDSWHYVLNKIWIDNSKDEEEFEKLDKWYENLENSVKEKVMIDSWQNIFDITPRTGKYDANGSFVQATFWKLDKDMISSMKEGQKMKTKILSLVLIVVMCLSLTASLCGCEKEQPETATQSQADTVASTEDPLWDNAMYKEDVTLDKGATSIDVEVKAGEKAITVTINTDATNLEDALLGAGLVEGEDGAYGLFIKKVNGIVADYDVDGAYWAMYKDGEYLTKGANETAISSGDHFELVRTK
jgi:hypothetical protein